MSRTPLVALALAAVLSAAGCGGSSKSSSTGATSAGVSSSTNATSAPSSTTTSTVSVATGPRLSHSQWIAKGDAICARLNTQLGSTVVKTTADFQRVLPQAAAYEQSTLNQLSALKPPSQYAHDWNAILENLEHWAGNSAKMGQEAQSPNFKINTQLLNETRVYQETFWTISKRDGFKKCSET